MPPNPPPPRRPQQQHHPVIGGGRNNSNEEAFQEVDPTGRFGRYAAMLGRAPSRRFDQEECIEVACIRVCLRALDPARVDCRHAEVRLLCCLHRDHIIGFHEVWLDHDAGVLNFITEVCNSASLHEYFDRHKHDSVKALKKWARASTTSTPATPASSAATVLAPTSLSTVTPAM